MRYFSVLFILLALILTFQNCQRPLQFLDLNRHSASSSADKSADHGQGYGGKPSVTFYVMASDVRFLGQTYIASGKDFKITPSLPMGLTLNSLTGEISGTPQSVTSDYINYTMTAVLSSGETQTFDLLLGVGYVYTVSSAIDGLGLPDADTTDGICADKNKICSLQAALDQAAANKVKTRIIVPEKKYSLNSELVTSASIEFVGVGKGRTIFDGMNLNRVLNLAGSDVTLSKLTVTRGKVSDPNFGAGILFNNGQGTLTIIDSEISYNVVSTLNRGGGGLYFNGKSLQVLTSSIHHNNSTGAGASPGGGGIYIESGKVLLQDSFIEDNQSGYDGAGLYGFGAQLVEISNVVFQRNRSQYNGAAINLMYGQSLKVSGSTFKDNQSVNGDGGAIFVEPRLTGEFSISDSSFSTNTAVSGGAVSTGQLPCMASSKHLVIHQSSFNSNVANINRGSVFNIQNRCTIEVDNSTLTGNSAGSCSVGPGGQVQSNGGNVDSGNSCGLN